VVLSDSGWTPGASWGDYDNDGYLDLYVVNFQPPERVNHLYHNNGNGTFTQITIDPPEASGACSIGSAWGDFDNDGYLDLFVTNDRNLPGHPAPSFRDNFFFHNNGDGTFSRITTGDIVKDGGHTSSVCDYDNDGFLDIMIPNGSLASGTNYLYHNDGNGNHWVNIRCVGTVSNRSAIGTRLRAKAMINGKAVWQTREIAQMSGCHANSDPRVHFGFGDGTIIDSLVIRWPSGRIDTYTALAVDNFYIAAEGQNIVPVFLANIYAEHSRIDRLYARKDIDSILFTTKFFNLYKHQFTAHLICADTKRTQIDSLTLFDDGLHGDSLANDGMYGAWIPPRSIDDFYTLSVGTVDLQLTKYTNVPDLSTFTTIPVLIDSIQQFTASTNSQYIVPFLKNAGSGQTVKNIVVKIASPNPWVTSILPAQGMCVDLLPGQIAWVMGGYLVLYDSTTFPGYFDFVFEITSNGQLYWVESTRLLVTGVRDEELLPTEYALKQNYPNPFNPSTTIKYALPRASHVTLKVYNTLGQEVSTLVDALEEPGYKSVEWNAAAVASGVYFYRLEAGDFVQMRKLLVLR
jgi:hypothetical protein